MMNQGFVRFLIKLAALAAVLAAVAAVVYKIAKKLNASKEALDEYLENSEGDDEDICYVMEDVENHLISDMEFWQSLNEQDQVEISFHVPAENSKDFQEKAASLGCSSACDTENEIVDVTVHGPLNEAELSALAQDLDAVCAQENAVYEGFTFD